jgi:hypothetical protein
MTTTDELKRRSSDAIDRRADEIIGIGERILHHPELGFKEVCTDMGDLSQVLPVLHPYVGGVGGGGHGADWEIVDKRLAYVVPAKALAAMAVDLLADGATGAGEVLASGRPRMSRSEYVAFPRGVGRREVFDGAATSP